MADLVIGATPSVASTTTTDPRYGTAGAVITPVQPIYRHTDGNLYPADNNLTLAEATVLGVSITGGGIGDKVLYFDAGLDVDPDVTVVKGKTYVLSANAGKICPIEDLVATNYLVYLFFGLSTTVLRMMLKGTGIQMP